MEDIEYRAYDPATGELRTADGISTREHVRRVRGMSVEQFEARFGSLDGETRGNDIADVDVYARRLTVLKLGGW